MDAVGKQRPVLADDLRPRIGIENRLPEFLEEALRLPQVPPELVMVLRRTSQAAIEHLADRFFRCMRREECDRMVNLVKDLGPAGMGHLREMLRMGPPRQASSVIGLLSRLDVPTLLELLPTRLPEWNRFYHDLVVRQIAYGAAPDRGRTLLEFLEILDPLVLPQALDEIGMSGDRTAVPPLIVMAEAGEAQGRSPLLQLKAVESLGRLREPIPSRFLRNLLEAKKMWKWIHPRELRIAAAQALAKIDPATAARSCQRAAWSRPNWRLRHSMQPRPVPGYGSGVMNASRCEKHFPRPLAVHGGNPASRFANSAWAAEWARRKTISA